MSKYSINTKKIKVNVALVNTYNNINNINNKYRNRKSIRFLCV